MKRTRTYLYMLLLLTSVFYILPVYSQSSQYALYNYRNDGDFNAWLNKDIEKITFSCIDTLGVEHDDIVVQEVWTSDSVYRIPLETIDSIGFRAPAPEYQDNVFHVTVQHLPYVTNVDQLSITFSSDLPSNMRPQVGMVITSDTFEEPLSNGFAGKIIDIKEDGSSLSIICETATVTDVFKKLVLVGNAQAVDKEEARSRPLRTTRGIFDKYEDGNQTEFEFPGKFTVKINDFVSITDEVKVSADYYIYVDLPKFKVRTTVTGTHDLKTSWSIDSDKILEWLGYEKDKHEPEWATPVWPIFEIPGIFTFGLKAGAFLAPSVKLSLTGSTPLTFTHTFGVEFSNLDTWLIPVVTPIMSAHSELGTPDITLSLEGKLFAGIALGIKTMLIGENVLSSDITGRFGPEFEAKIQMKQAFGEDDHFNLYSLMKDSKIGVQLKADAKVKALVFGDNLTDNLEWDWKWPIPGWEESRYLFPDFTKPELPDWAMPDPLSMYSKPSKDVVMPVQLGIGLFDKDGVKQKEYYCDDWYLLEKENKDIPKVYLGDMTPGATYTCRPMFNFLGLGEIVADPRTTFTVPNPVSMELSSLRIMKGDSKDVEIVGGWGNYKIVNSEENIAIASFNNSKDETEDNQTSGVGDNNLIWSAEGTPSMHIVGIDLGETTIDVMDLRSNETTSLNVVVTDKDTSPFYLSESSIDIYVNMDRSVNIMNGSGEYEIINDYPDIIEADINGVHEAHTRGRQLTRDISDDGEAISYDLLWITGKKIGNAVLKVKDKATGESVSINVAVTKAPSLTLETKTVEISVGDEKNVEILMGSGWYELTNSSPDIISTSKFNMTVSSEGGRDEEDVSHYEGTFIKITALSVGTAIIKVKDMSSLEVITITVTVKGDLIDIPADAIDLGLPSGTKWASYNVGATKPEDFGGYYAWGETEEKSVYSAETYMYCDGTEETCHDLGESICGTNYDVAHVRWGDNWQMPSNSQFEELISNCTQETTTLNGIKGVRFTGSNGNSIFLPAAGEHYSTVFEGQNDYGDYFSGTQYSDQSYAYGFYFGYEGWGYEKRWNGHSVRPVYIDDEEQDNIEKFTVNGISFKMVKVEGGTFLMGTPDDDPDVWSEEIPQHQVTLSDFSIGQTEVTQALWEAVMGNNPSDHHGRNLPVELVSWDDCQTFILKLNALLGRTFRLPTEAEWEFAARGGNYSKGYKYAGSNDLDVIAWYYDNSNETTHSVGTKAPNELGLYDMSGNVWEWCQDWYANYNSSAQSDPTGPSSGTYRIDRGGGWYDQTCRVAKRDAYMTDYMRHDLGLRLALTDGTSEEVMTCCSDFFPEDNATLEGTYVPVGCKVTFPWNGEMNMQIVLSDNPSMGSKIKSVRQSITGTYGSVISCSSSFSGLESNKKYYWQVSYFDFEEENWRIASPIMSFTTGTE